jgi:Arc/MetJ-type ribon-helix-helix transcriptional regulator
MQITLNKDQEDWLREQVAAGQFPSLESAVAAAIEQLRLGDDDLEWARPLVAEGLAELDRGEALSADEAFARAAGRSAKSR